MAPNAVAQQITEVGGIAGGVGSTIQVLRPGFPIRSFFVYRAQAGRRQAGLRDTDGDGVINEKDLYVDLNGDGNINVDDRRPLHDPAPDWIFGHSSYLSLGRFGLNFTLRAYLGNYVYNNVASNLGTYSELTGHHRTTCTPRSWRPVCDAAVSSRTTTSRTGPSSGWTTSPLDYRFDWQNRPWRVFGAMQNAFTITGLQRGGPDGGLDGIDNNLYPRARTFTGA